MDWHMLEIGIVTTLSMWVWLFSPSPVSRWIAAAVFAFNVFYVIVERERPAREPMRWRPAEQRRAQEPASGSTPRPELSDPEQGKKSGDAGGGDKPPTRII